MAIKRQEQGPCGDRRVLYLSSIDIYILVVILYYSFARCFHWEKPSKGYRGISVLFFTSACETTIPPNKIFHLKNANFWLPPPELLCQ